MNLKYDILLPLKEGTQNSLFFKIKGLAVILYL